MSQRIVRLLRACRVDDVPKGEGRTAVLEGRRVAIFHTNTGWHCVDAECPHRGGPLADGIVADHTVICPIHQFRFDLLTGDPLGHGCSRLRTHPIEVRGTEVFVYIAAMAPDSVAA